MKSQELFEKLERTDPAAARQIFIDYLHEASQKLESAKESSSEIAYDIAGMFTTDFARSLSENDPLVEIMTIAGELEIKPENAEDLQRELIDKIREVKL